VATASARVSIRAPQSTPGLQLGSIAEKLSRLLRWAATGGISRDLFGTAELRVLVHAACGEARCQAHAHKNAERLFLAHAHCVVCEFVCALVLRGVSLCARK